jgi:PTS system mannose-specific IIC component
VSELLLVALVGGVLALDATSVGQFMISRPLVAGWVTGWLMGDAALGLSIGALLEVYLLVSFPTGGSRFPEGSTAAVVAVASATAVDSPAAIPGAVAFGLVWGQIAGFTVTGLRRLNGRIVPGPGKGAAQARHVVRAHVGALGLDLLRGALVTAAGAMLGPVLVEAVAASWTLSPQAAVGLLLAGGAVSLGILLRDLGGFRSRKLLFAAGVALGVAGARFL